MRRERGPAARAQSLGFYADGVDPSIGTVPSPRSCDTQERTHERTQYGEKILLTEARIHENVVGEKLELYC